MIHNLKPLPVYHQKCQLNTKNILDNLNKIDYDYISKNDNYFSTNTNILDDKKLCDIKKEVDKKVLEFTTSILGIEQELYITESWVAKTIKGGHHSIHNHPNSLFSGVLYLQIPTESSILFHYDNDLFKNFKFEFNFKNFNEYNSQVTRIMLNNNDLIIFPSWLNHSVEINNSQTERIVLGFNTFVKGNFGNSKYPTRLVL